MSFPHTLVLVAGPTASGKTSVGIELARHYQSEIISADSRQCFKELDIGVARPTAEQLAAVPHHFIASHSIQEEVNAATFAQYAGKKLDILFEKNNLSFVVGGTGLYIKALIDGLDDIPETDTAIRQNIQKEYESNGIGWLQEELKIHDPQLYASIDIANPQRMMRALEVVLSTGRSIRSFQTKTGNSRNFNVIMTGLEVDREKLVTSINTRVDAMINNGLEAEARRLYDYRQLNALRSVGYREMYDYIDGLITLEECIERIKINTRKYAKRQMTWFRKVPGITWFDPSGIDSIIHHIDQKVEEFFSGK